MSPTGSALLGFRKAEKSLESVGWKKTFTILEVTKSRVAGVALIIYRAQI